MPIQLIFDTKTLAIRLDLCPLLRNARILLLLFEIKTRHTVFSFHRESVPYLLRVTIPSSVQYNTRMYILVSFVKRPFSASSSFFLSHDEVSPRLLFVITLRFYLIPLFSHCFPSFLPLELPLRPHTRMVARTRVPLLHFPTREISTFETKNASHAQFRPGIN